MSDQCTKGTNWGVVSIDDKNLCIKYNQSNIIKLPLKKVVNSNTQKNDIVLQLSTDDYGENDDMLCEVRFYIPPQEQKLKQEKEKKKQENEENQNSMEEEDDGADEDAEPTFQQKLQNEILTKAKIGQSSADSILTIHDVPLIVPRGKYTMDFFTKDIRFHGNTYQFTTDYKGISRFFLLPMPDEINLSFVIGLEHPFKQGQTTYNFLVMQFKKEVENEIKLKYSRQKLDEIGWKGIKEEYSGPLYDIVCEVLSEITGIKVVSPKNFKSKNGLFCLRCSVGPHSGFLFPLEKSLIYLQKPVLHIKHEEIKEVVFQRIGSTNLNKFFDVKIIYKNQNQLFSGIERDELDNLTQYFQQKKIAVRKLQDEVPHLPLDDSDDEEDDDDSRSKKKNKTNIDPNNMDSDDDDDDFHAGEDEEDGSESEGSDEPESASKNKK
ncbi:unnamed protein product [Paramecium primaurelia]|uniref:Histone chaperone RTT106/FACT complex subunit SPT16-like middle domain-containing protein n=1 Tax=Paramecium primaurelia TaxID=5886 RepID=A0A8S1LTE5_PARPR|nr:unnamed protein product [Paramecium primaurelia]